MTGRGGDSDALRGAAAFVAGPQPIREQRLHHSRAATAQTAGIRGVGMPQARAILGLMRLNFLSVEDLRLQFEAMGQPTPEEKGVARAVLEGLLLTRAASHNSSLGFYLGLYFSTSPNSPPGSTLLNSSGAGATCSRRGPVKRKLGRTIPPRPISLALLLRTI